jgi:hypothetical protein
MLNLQSQYQNMQCAEQQGNYQSALMGAVSAKHLATLAPKQPGLADRAEELMNYIARLGANQSLMREKLFGEGESKCVVDSDRTYQNVEALLAAACQSAANLVGESEGILKRL